MLGYFIYNRQLLNDKFLKLKSAFINESKKLNIDLIFIDNPQAYIKLSDNNLERNDFVIFWDKDVKLAKLLENSGHRLFNNSKSIELCDDKSKTYISLLNKNIKQPVTVISPLIFNDSCVNYNDFIEYSIVKIGFPIVVKECYGSYGQQVYLANDKKELINVIDKLGTRQFILQEFISTSYGKDIRIEVIGNNIIAAVYRRNENDFRANITNGGIATKYIPNNNQIEMAIKVAQILNLDFAGVDILFGKNDEPILCEVNSNAYPINVQNVVGVNIVREILKYIVNKIK